jgi:predicted unusual protein kinase regulating ubiquinone biosynthesis (AarF/ABC1/UbiB family)
MQIERDLSRPATKGKRFFKLASMTASVAGRYAKTRLKGIFQDEEAAADERLRANRESGSRIAETLGELKGAVMKVGQMASIASDVLPPEFSDALSKLQKEAPPMKFEVIADQIEAELGASPDVLFSSFDHEPFAAASIGQVHRARTDDGREVIVKVQYPGVQGAVDSDLSQLKIALRASGIVTVSKASLDAGFAELRTRLHEELDYCNEADNVRAFRKFHARHPWMVVPDVVGERSAMKVLTLTYEEGDAPGKVDGLNYTQEERDELGLRLFQMMCEQIFVYGRIHGDPNPGNLAFRRDGKIVLYDFGCVKDLKQHIVEAYRDTIQFGIAEDYDRVDESLITLGLRNVAGPHPGPDYYKPWRDTFANPFMDHPVFDFAKADIHDRVMKLIPKAMKHMSSFQVAKELIFLDRMVSGHYGNLRALRARLPVTEILFPYLDSLSSLEYLSPDPVSPAIDQT